MFRKGKPCCWLISRHQGQIEEITVVIAFNGKLVVIVAQQCRFHLIDELAQMLAVGRHGVALRAELLVIGVCRQQVDVGQVGRIALAEIGDQPPQRGKVGRSRLVANEIICNAPDACGRGPPGHRASPAGPDCRAPAAKAGRLEAVPADGDAGPHPTPSPCTKRDSSRRRPSAGQPYRSSAGRPSR